MFSIVWHVGHGQYKLLGGARWGVGIATYLRPGSHIYVHFANGIRFGSTASNEKSTQQRGQPPMILTDSMGQHGRAREMIGAADENQCLTRIGQRSLTTGSIKGLRIPLRSPLKPTRFDVNFTHTLDPSGRKFMSTESRGDGGSGHDIGLECGILNLLLGRP